MLQPPGCPSGGNRMLQPSSSRSCIDVDHRKLKSAELTASKYAFRGQKCPRLTVYSVEPSAETAGARLSALRCEPHVVSPGLAFALGGQGSGCPEKFAKHF